MAYTIEKGVPLPGKGDEELFTTMYQMEVGDSFFVENATARSLGNIVGNIGRRMNARFLARTCTGGARVWRVEGIPDPLKPRAKKARARKPKAVTVAPAETAPLQAAE